MVVAMRNGTKRRRLAVEQATARGLADRPGCDASEVGDLASAGPDSLMALELRNALGESLDCGLPATVLHDQITIYAIVRYVSQELSAPEAK